MKALKIILALFIAQTIGFFAAQPVFCQTEKLDIVTFTPPAGWTKTMKDGLAVYNTYNKTSGGFCLLTVYPSSASGGSPNKDFAAEWNEKVAKPFKVEANPKAETQTQDGWTSVSAASSFESDGVKSAAMMTVISGYGRTASILVLFNNQEYLPQIDAFMSGITMDKGQAVAEAKTAVQPAVTPSSNSFLGKWAKSFAGTNGRDQSGNVLNSEYYKSQYTFNPDGTYSFKAEKWLGYIRSNDFWVTEESGSYAVSGEMLTITPTKSVTSLKNRDGVLQKTEVNPLEKATYKWTLYYFSGIKETDLILHTNTETHRDGPYGSNDLFPKSYFYSQTYKPEWRF